MSDTKTIDKLVAEIDDYTRDIWKQLESPGDLSETILRLAVLNMGLGNHLADTVEMHDKLELKLKYERELIKLSAMKEGETAAKAESLKIVDTKDMADDLYSLAHIVNVLKIKRADIEKVIEASRSRLAVIRDDMRNS